MVLPPCNEGGRDVSPLHSGLIFDMHVGQVRTMRGSISGRGLGNYPQLTWTQPKEKPSGSDDLAAGSPRHT